jgi:hypothetical protein
MKVTEHTKVALVTGAAHAFLASPAGDCASGNVIILNQGRGRPVTTHS